MSDDPASPNRYDSPLPRGAVCWCGSVHPTGDHPRTTSGLVVRQPLRLNGKTRSEFLGESD